MSSASARQEPPETPLAHVQRHPRTFLDIVGEPGAAITARAWCVDCDYELELTEEDADGWAELGVPWRTGTE